MRIRLAKSAKEALLKYAFNNYGQIRREMAMIDITKLSLDDLLHGNNPYNKILEIIVKYSPKLIKEYNITMDSSSNPRFDYFLRMKKKKKRIR